ncbi:Radical SAM domain protein [Flavobacteriales bacterium ALC-1]|nr:Radical SAM domain protein [Flavobacteriales bacterium ALC-1]
MSIVLTHTYYLYDDVKEQAIMKPYPPLGLLYISGYLNAHKVENHIYDSTFFSKEKQLQFIEEKQPKVVAIYTNLMTKINVIKLVKILKNDSKYGYPKLILGGPDITYNCEKYLNTGVDFLIIGEGEETTLELYEAIVSERDFSTITGIAYLENDNVKKTPPRTKMKDLSDCLYQIEMQSYEKYLEVGNNHGKSSMTVSTQRGVLTLVNGAVLQYMDKVIEGDQQIW